ncbi:hypothetical protein BCV73_30940 [Paenibacillus sp. SSG-1]|nr:hypothetical protein BCV73_30940 [Paenibacillus sp. SSG-1]
MIFIASCFMMNVKNIGSGVTGDNVDPTTMEHRNIRPVAWAKEQFCGMIRGLLFFSSSGCK